uniref:(northern house mosquito) hypothetical protein n=1 Tax=Culex pipiens TaxID=7175 RepID=A0A8D8BIZ7_CULPI
MNLGLGPAGTSFGVAKSTRIISDLLSATNLEKKKMHKYIPNQFEPVSPTGRSVQPTAVFGSGLRHGPVIVVGSNGGTDHLRNVANAGLDFMPSSSVRSPRRCGNLWNARFSFSSSASEE